MSSYKSPFVVTVILSDRLAEQTKEVVRLLREEPKNPSTSERSIDLLTKAVEQNLEFYFVQPAKDLDMGPLAQKALAMGVHTIVKLTSSIGHKISKKSTPTQKARIADFVESTLLYPEK